MIITDIRVHPFTKPGKVKAAVSITLDDVFVIHDIKIVDGEKGLFVAMPSRKSAENEYRDIAHPINTETRTMVSTMILAKYYEILDSRDSEESAEESTEESTEE